MSNNPQNPLLVAELFQCVLECLVTSLPERPNKEERRMLAVLARTCRAFSEPSLNCLWRRLNSLLPLVRCFSDVVDEARVQTPPSSLEWLAINRYSPRIRELTLGNERLSLYFLICTGLILPNLKVFRWEVHHRSNSNFSVWSMSFIGSLLTPGIVTLEIKLRSSPKPTYLSFLENYLQLCPNLRSIKLLTVGIQYHQAASEALSRAICSNTDWRHVELSPPIDDVVLKHLGVSSTLKTVSLTMAPQAARPDEACFGREDTPFRNVTNLTLTLWDSLDSATCLLRPHDQLFHSFGVTFHALIIVATEVSTLFTTLASPQRVHSLQSINVTHIQHIFNGLDTSSVNNIHAQPFSFETFRPLVPLVHLRKLVISLDHPTSLNDEEFASLVRNWPLLEVLRMTWVNGEHPAASLTLKGLLSLLASCQKLRMISLTLDANDVPVVGTHTDVCNPSITCPIAFHNSPLKCPDLVARFLKIHLPSVLHVDASFTRAVYMRAPATANDPNHLMEHEQLWFEVNKLLDPVFARSSDNPCAFKPRPIEVDYY